ncbi:MAG: PilZ domain-containing protein [Myxococcota bacterium]
MESIALCNPETLPLMTAEDRRRYPRTLSHTTCTVKTRHGVDDYTVRNLSVSGALLTGGPVYGEETPVQILLHMPLYPDIPVLGRVVRRGRDDEDRPFIGIEFNNHGDVTEDHIQSALLSEIERSQTNGKISDLLA